MTQVYAYLKFTLVFLGFGLLLLGVSLLAMYHPVRVSIATHIAFPLGLLLWKGMETFLGSVKVYSLVLCRIVFVLATLGYGVDHVVLMMILLLQINILEVTLADFYRSAYLNGLIGLLLIVTAWWMPMDWTGTHIIVIEDYLYWIIAYTIWDFNIVARHAQHPYLVAHTIILLVPLSCLFLYDNTATWLTLRELSLASGMILLRLRSELFKTWVFQHISPEKFERFKTALFSKPSQLFIFVLNAILILLQVTP